MTESDERGKGRERVWMGHPACRHHHLSSGRTKFGSGPRLAFCELRFLLLPYLPALSTSCGIGALYYILGDAFNVKQVWIKK